MFFFHSFPTRFNSQFTKERTAVLHSLTIPQGTQIQMNTSSRFMNVGCYRNCHDLMSLTPIVPSPISISTSKLEATKQ